MASKYSITELRSLVEKWLEEDMNDISGMTFSDALEDLWNFVGLTTPRSEEQHAKTYSRAQETSER